jgi:hypothetical protein
MIFATDRSTGGVSMRWIVLSLVSMLLAAPVLNGATYVVGYGDTLWDLSIHYYGTPYHWEDILYANEHVVDQYHLMPGQVLIIPGIVSSSVYSTSTFSNVFGYYNASAEPLLSRLQLETAGFVASQPVVPLGYVLITNVEESDQYFRELAIHGDVIEIDLGASEGYSENDVFHILSASGEWVKDPNTGMELGQVMRVAGVCRIIGVTPATSIALVEHAYRPIYEGDLIVPYDAAANIVVDNYPDVDGLTTNILAFRDDEIMNAYTFNVVYMTRGSNDGLNAGDVFTAYNYGENMYTPGGENVTTADLPIADVVILDTGIATCTALVTMNRTDDLIAVGDMLHLTHSQLD